MQLPGQQLPEWGKNLSDALKKGAETGRMLSLLPAERQQEVAKATMDKIASEQGKESKARFDAEVKAIQKAYPGDPVRQANEIMMARLREGVYWNSGGAGQDPALLYKQDPGAVVNPPAPSAPARPGIPQTPNNNQQPGVLDKNVRKPNPDEVMLDQNQQSPYALVSNAPSLGNSSVTNNLGIPAAAFLNQYYNYNSQLPSAPAMIG